MIDWRHYDHLLGKIPDTKIANKIGCAVPTVLRRRNKLDIAPHSKKLAWSDEDNLLFIEKRKIKCRKCNLELPIEQFTKNKQATHGYRKECRECHQKIIKKRRRKIKGQWTDKMGGCCQNCGFCKWIGPLQFHHVEWKWQDKNPDNTYPNLVMYRKYDEAKIREELDKCCLLCSTCHDAIHSDELRPEFIKRDELGWTVKNPQRLAHL